MSVSGEQLNHAIKMAWPADEHVKAVEERYLKVIQGLVEQAGGRVTIKPEVFTGPVNFVVEQDDSGSIFLSTK